MRTLMLFEKKKKREQSDIDETFVKQINDFPFFSFLVYLAKFLSVLNYHLLIGASCNGTKFLNI